MTEQSDRLRRLSLNDQRYLDSQLAALSADAGTSHLNDHGRCLSRLAALFALDGAASTYGWATSDALAAGATSDELVDLLVTLAPLIGSARVVSAAPKLGLALGYDVEADIEGLDAGLAS